MKGANSLSNVKSRLNSFLLTLLIAVVVWVFLIAPDTKRISQ
jgi:hypothetical protein